MKIIQIAVNSQSTHSDGQYIQEEVLGLGEDNLVYKWSYEKAEWELFKMKPPVDNSTSPQK